jgi:hypothetical protein
MRYSFFSWKIIFQEIRGFPWCHGAMVPIHWGSPFTGATMGSPTLGFVFPKPIFSPKIFMTMVAMVSSFSVTELSPVCSRNAEEPEKLSAGDGKRLEGRRHGEFATSDVC